MRPNVGADREGWITGRTLNGCSKADAADRQLRVNTGGSLPPAGYGHFESFKELKWPPQTGRLPDNALMLLIGAHDKY
jgi:hypothetical protein